MRNYLPLCVVAALATFLTTFSSCSKKSDELILQLPSTATVDSIKTGIYNITDDIMYNDDTGIKMEFNPVAEMTPDAKLSVLRTWGHKTLYTFTLLKQSETDYVIEFSKRGIYDGEGVDVSNILNEYNGAYKLSKVGTTYQLTQIKKLQPKTFYFH